MKELPSNELSPAMKNHKVYTLLLLIKENKILLGYKKRGFGQGKWNGFGGKVESGESPAEASVREMKEESGVHVNDIEKIAELNFEFICKPKLMEVHVFKTSKYEGNIEESDEMLPKWFDISEVPYESMWADDKLWYPLMFKGLKFKGNFVFENDTMLKHDIVTVDDI